MKKRIISLILALALCVGMLPAPAWAEEPTDPTQAVEVVGAANPSEETDPTTEPTEGETEPTEAPKAAEVPAEETAAPGEDEAVAAVQAMIDALPDVGDMSESYLDALVAAYSAFDALSEAQQAQINGVEKLEALFGWVNSQVSTLATEETISGEVNWNNRTLTTPVKLTGDTTLTLVGDNKIECDAPLDLNNCSLTVKGTGSLTVIGNGRSEDSTLNGAIFDSGYKGTKSGLGTLCLEGGTVTARGGKYNAISVRSVELRGGKLEAYGGSNAGIVCSYLYTYGGSLYATGDKYGIEMRTTYAGNPGKLPILTSDEKYASMAEMDVGTIGDIINYVGKTYYIGEVTGPMLSVKAQKGYLYEGTADQTATFSYSAKNLDGCMFGVEWTGDHPGLTAEFSLSVDQTIIVTTKDTVKQGTYELKLTAADAESAKTLATKTFTVTVLGAPITVTTQPQDAFVSCKRGDLDAWQGDKKIQVTATRAEGLTEDITYQWKLEGGTELDNCTGYELFLQDLFAGGKLPPVVDKPWLLSAKVYCTLTVGSYSVNTNAVTLTVNTCAHERANPNGTCQQCGEPCSSEPLLVREDGIYYAVQDTSGIGAAKVGVNLVVGGTFYLTKDVIHRSLDATYTPAGDKNVILDLQGHTLESLDMGNFPVGSFTLKNGTLNQCVYSTATEGKLILDGVTFMAAYATNSSYLDITVQGESVFKEKVSFSSVEGVAHLRGGTFEKGIDTSNGAQPLALLADGYAFRNDQGIVDASNPENLKDKIQVVAHTCKYVNGKCACGRSCDHSTVSDETGLCQKCGSQVYEANVTTADGTVTGYRTLEEALRNGADATVKLLADCVVKEREEAFCVEVPLTLDLNGKRMEGPSGLIVKKGPTTILDGSPAKTGTIAGTSNWEYSGMGLGVFNNANVTLTILGGRFEGKTDGLQMLGQNTLILKGGSFSSIRFKEGATATLRDSLAPGYAYYKDADNTLYDPGDDQEATVGLHVGVHTEHTPDSSGHCPCGYTVAATLDTEAGKQYFADFSEALEAAKAASGSTLTLFQDVALTGENNLYIDSGTFTIDWNGHTISGETSYALLCITDAAKVTLTDSVGTGGVRNTGLGAAVRIAVESRGSVNIQGGTYSPQVMRSERCYGSVQISGGIFETPQDSGRSFALYDESGSPLSGMLVDGTAFAYDADGSELLNAYAVSQSDSYKTVYAVAHTHESFDEDGVCACGYTCPHEHWTDGMCDLCGKICPHDHYENGKCTVCGYPCPHEDVTENGGVYTCDICGLTMTVMVETADGISYTTDLAAALNNAEDGTTVKLLGDLVLTKSANIEGGKNVTLNLNGHNITRATWQIIQVKGNTDDGTKAKLVITGSGEIRFNVKAIDGGQLDMSGWTGTVAFVDLENACDFVGPAGDGHLGELNISNWRSDNKGTILLQGGTIGKLWLNSFESFQMTLGSLLKSGYAAKSGSEYLPYDHAISDQDKILNNLTIEPCPHTGLDSSGRCTYCNATGFVATVTKDDVTAGYTDFLSALDEICDGKRGTLKLLKDIPVEEGHPFGRISGILDLNGKNLACDLTCIQGSSLQIVNSGSDMSRMERLEVWNGAKVTIADTAGSIHFNVVWVEIGSVADLLPEGGAYIAHDGTWISAADAAAIQSLEKVAVKEAPVKSVTLTANKTTVPYGESQTVTLTASATLSEGGTASYAWAEVASHGVASMGEDEASFTLPAGVNAGEHTYRVSVTVGDYTLSKDIQITVTKAPGTLVNKDYPTEFTYGDTVPTPKAENFTSNHPDGTFSYHWKTGNNPGLEPGANPVDAGTYILYATWTAGTNHTTASLSLAVTIQKAAQTANISVVNETISGKGDGGVKLLPSAEGYEMREKGETTFEPIPASQGQTFVTLAPGVTYEIRLAETKNYLPSAIQEITVQPGRKLEVILPTNQKGYTLTASKTQLDWNDDVELTFQLNPVGAYKAADFGIWAEAGSEKTKLTLGNDGAVKLTAPEKDITITVTGVKTDNREPKASIQGRQLTENSLAYVKWEGFQKNPVDDFVNGDFVISAADRGSGVASIWYCLSQTPLTLAEMDTASWVSAPLTGTNQAKVPITENGVYYLYVKALDKANNAGYACTGKLVKESNPPTFSGVEKGKTYYVTQQMEIHDDGMPDWYMAKGSIGVVPNGGDENPIKLKLKNDGSPYTITAGDRCGNEASITVYMKPLTDLTDRLYGILEESIQKSDRATLDEVEATLKGLDVTYATEPEKKEINDALARIAELRQVLDQVAAVEAQIDALPDSVEPYQQTVEDTQIKPARQAYSDLTDHQKTLVDSTKLDKLVRLEAQLNAWTITEGDGQTWYKGSWNPLSFTVNGQTRKFSKVLLDGKMHITATPSFLAVSGSIDEPFTLTLKPEFLQVWMKPGEHTLTVIYGENNSGTGTVTFTVKIPANYLDVTGKPEFDGKTTVTVDGKEYPIEEMNGTRYVNLPETGDLLTIYSFKDGTQEGSYTNYPTGMQVFRITRQEGGAKAEEITEFANLLNYAGCSIRLTGTKGIRMITGIGEDARTALTGARGLGGYTLEEYGTVVMRGVGTPTLENSKSHNFAYKKDKADPIFSRANGMIQYTNVLVGFSLEDCKDTLTLRPYIKLKDTTTGETVTLYGGCVSRSIGYIAKQNENTYKPGTAGYKYIHEIIDAVYGKTEQGGETK